MASRYGRRMTRHKPFFFTAAPALGSALLWGLVECLALWRSRFSQRRMRPPRR
jgi:hypothetical protein